MGSGKRVIATVTNDLSYDQRMQRICTSLSAAGYEVLLVGRQLPQSIELTERPYEQFRIKCNYQKGPLFYLEYQWRLYKFLKSARVDILHTVDLDTSMAAILLNRKRKTPIVFDAHEYFVEVPEVQNRPIVKWIWSLVDRMISKKARIILSVSDSITRYYQKKTQNPVYLIRNMPILRFRNVVKPESLEASIIYQGALNEGRCIDQFILAMHQINARLLIAGEGDLSDELRALVEREKLAHKVVFLGKLSPEVLWQRTQEAYLGLNVLEKKGLSYYYSLSNKCFDYVQAHIPQIGSAFPEYVKLNEAFEVMSFAEPSANDIALKINQLIHDKTYYNRLKKNAELASNRWNWAEEEKELLKAYEGIS
jgi:glycosyltransferase involved in cell wall biosynthesis